MTTDVHEIISFDSGRSDRRGETAWAAGFYVLIAVAVLVILVRAVWPPEERLTRETATDTQPR